MKLTPVTFKFDSPYGIHEKRGFYVPGTNNLLAIDLRETDPDDWRITHLPTGMYIGLQNGCSKEKKKDVIAFAQGFYREATALGADLTSSNPKVAVSKANALSNSEKIAFWQRVWPKRDAA